ncbi:MAG: TatD family hydrolase [Candidatus Omnitrophica bacterium]|nr:TatD family hydrolase [Candidatus Omnitrophota bacterium]
MQTYDTHAHLDHLENFEQALNNAQQAGVKGIVAVSMDLASCRKNLEIKQTTPNPRIFLGMGMHPSEANLEDLPACLDLARKHRQDLTAIGEIGLDFWYKWVRKDQEKKDQQRQVFKAFLELAKELDLPVVIHSRGAWRECFETTKTVGIKKANFHWYSGPIDVLNDIMGAGYFVSTTPNLAYSEPSREAIAQARNEQILIETDCPVYFRNPSTEEGFKAEPKDVFKTLQAFCELKQMEKEEAVARLNQNAEEFFNIKEPS